ncbi:MAG: hypothetical protein MUE85_07790 [Microscillaceae bacterium]|jgi:hypothetical protein|nr:hypothetical protein [Microscillaceae bacterium]
MADIFRLNRAAMLGIALLAMVWLFYVAYFLELVWQNDWLMFHIFRPIDALSSWLMAAWLAGLPVLAILINLDSVLKGKVYLKQGLIGLGLQIELNIFNWLIIFASVFALVLVLGLALAKRGLLWLGYFEVVIFHLIRLIQQIFG